MTFQKWFEESIDYALHDATEIGVINFSNQKVTSLEGIEKLKNLHTIYCEYNRLVSLEGIEKLKHLEIIYCGGNNIKSLKSIEKIKTIIQLYCEHNELTSLKGIENLENLEYVYYGYNPVTGITKPPSSTDELRKLVRVNSRKEKIGIIIN